MDSIKSNIDFDDLTSQFHEIFGNSDGVQFFRAPGRVNLIGEHTDYNDGFVLPFAIDMETVVAAKAHNGREFDVHSTLDNARCTIKLGSKAVIKAPGWAKYIQGVANILEERGLHLSGSEMMIDSTIPVGAGLSSSAALELSTGLAMLSSLDDTPDLKMLALSAQQAEHEYAHVNCGIMDQFTSAFGKKDHALLIDCRSLEIEAIPLHLLECEIVVCNTGVKHTLSSSAYNERRKECEMSVELLKSKLPAIKSLRDVSVANFNLYQDVLPQPLRKRAKHVVTEIARTLEAADALRANDAAKFGTLMNESHRSLRDDYEVSCVELDLLVDLARANGALGARMTGGGFGGCTINIVPSNEVEPFRQVVANNYRNQTRIVCETYLLHASDGACEVIMN